MDEKVPPPVTFVTQFYDIHNKNTNPIVNFDVAGNWTHSDDWVNSLNREVDPRTFFTTLSNTAYMGCKGISAIAA